MKVQGSQKETCIYANQSLRTLVGKTYKVEPTTNLGVSITSFYTSQSKIANPFD